MMNTPLRYFDRDLSWLGFNGRVLEEARNPAVPLYERIRFLSIFSSNLDEFFRVRYPALKAAGKEAEERGDLLSQVQELIGEQQEEYGRILSSGIIPQLRQEGIHLYYNEPLMLGHHEASADWFYSEILGYLQPVMLREDKKGRVRIQNNGLYFVVLFRDGAHALLNIPVEELSRFIMLPATGGMHHIAFLDDIIRHYLGRVFPSSEIENCYSIKLTLDADIDLADEWSERFEEQVEHMIRKREQSAPARLLYDAAMPDDTRKLLREFFGLTKKEMMKGGRYHNLRDLAALPNPAGNRLLYPPAPPLPHPRLAQHESLFDSIRTQDEILHLPYQQYSYILRFFNEAATDPQVQEIFVTLYRVAARSHIANALISAARNGKSVTVFVELKARFDEANNLAWAKKMKAAGVRIVYSIPGMKVHSKLALVRRKTAWSSEYFGILGTGNFNETTARFYTDHLLLTADKDLTREMELLFAYLRSRAQPGEYDFLRFGHLMVSRFNLSTRLQELVEREIAHKAAGREARILLKLNNLQERDCIELLYKASNAGVQVDLIVRGICCLVPGVPGQSEHITLRRIVDRYLEHARVFVFHNDGREEIFLGSADLMERNLHRRIEVVFPVKAEQLKAELKEILRLQLADNTQARLLNAEGAMQPVPHAEGEAFLRAQEKIYEMLKGQQRN